MSAPELHTEQGSPLSAEPEDERLPIPMIVAVALVSAVVFALGILWAVAIMGGVESDAERKTGPRAQATDLGKPEIGMVDQTLFAREARAAQLKEEKLHQLESYGWVSRQHGVIHIPIDEAMKAVAEGKRPPGAGAPQPPPAPLPPVPSSGADVPSSAPAAPIPGSPTPTGAGGNSVAPVETGSSTGGAGPNSPTPQKP
jgi:hypothetical protein